jgi:glucose-6-phosphate 1-dehydrogenase
MVDIQIKPFFTVIFGGDGDLSKRKIIPAFYHRFVDGQLTMPFQVVCVSRSLTNEKNFKQDLIGFIAKSLKSTEKPPQIDEFMTFVSLINIPENNTTTFNAIKIILEKEESWQRVFYFSVPSAAFPELCTILKEANLLNEKSKIVLEKPLGNSLKSSREINAVISKAFKETQIFRIDHYLGKETVQNIMVLRFANHLFERAWNADNIESVQITVAEDLGVENRAGYYDKTGALLDMVQNHLLQILCLIAMEPPSNLNADTVRNEKLKVLEALRPFSKSTLKDNVVRGQYTRGEIIGDKGNSKRGSYLEDIEQYGSDTETFVAIKAFIDNWRWKNTPFYLRTGKRMKKRYSDVVINFKAMPHSIFPDSKYPLKNKLIIRLQPDERIELVQLSKIPGPGGYRFKPISLKLDFVDTFKERMPGAYERLMIDILRGNQTLFMRHDELDAAWRWIESINTNWKKQLPLELYESGSWGPGDQVLQDGHEWQQK